jgi:hypothetical protein
VIVVTRKTKLKTQKKYDDDAVSGDDDNHDNKTINRKEPTDPQQEMPANAGIRKLKMEDNQQTIKIRQVCQLIMCGKPVCMSTVGGAILRLFGVFCQNILPNGLLATDE